jgi:transcriptional regulator with XRE-family HTH domain
MSDFFKSNLIVLRERKGESQTEIALGLGLNRSTYANYETGANLPKADILFKIVRYFNIPFEDLMNFDLRNTDLNKKESGKETYEKASQINPQSAIDLNKNANAYFGLPRIISTNNDGHENIVHVPIKSRAGYLSGYGDRSFIETLPSYHLPFLRNGTFRSFEVEGHSMKPTVLNKDYVVGQWVEGIKDIRENRVHIIITKNDGVLIKRVLNRIKDRGVLYLVSDTVNSKSDYPTIELTASEISEIWYARLRFTTDFSDPSDFYTRLNDIEIDLLNVKKQLGIIK